MSNNQNAFTIIILLATGEDTDNDNVTTVTQTAVAATTGSTLGDTNAATAASTTFLAEVTAGNPTVVGKSNGHDITVCSVHRQHSTPASMQHLAGTPSTRHTCLNPAGRGVSAAAGGFQQGCVG